MTAAGALALAHGDVRDQMFDKWDDTASRGQSATASDAPGLAPATTNG